MGAVIGLAGGFLLVLLAFVISLIYVEDSPTLIGPELSKDYAKMRTYTLIDSLGEKISIISNKPLMELIKNLDQLALDDEFNKACTS